MTLPIHVLLARLVDALGRVDHNAPFRPASVHLGVEDACDAARELSQANQVIRTSADVTITV